MGDTLISAFFAIPIILITKRKLMIQKLLPLVVLAFLSQDFAIRELGANADVFLWPQPQNITWGSGPAILISPNFTIHAPAQEDLTTVAAHYQNLVLTECWFPVVIDERSVRGEEEVDHAGRQSPYPFVNTSSPGTAPALLTLDGLLISVNDLSADLQHGVDETYTLVVPDDGGVARLTSATVWGAIHGLETFSQLVREANDDTNLTSQQQQQQLVIDHGVSIADGPLYPHRGLLLDTGRNFFPVDSILRTIRAMGHNKLNVFHWHITDSQSFPIQLPSEPLLAAKGSYGRKFQYSALDVANIVKYARSFGVRVIPEIDMPGHTASFGGAYPEIVTCTGQIWNNFAAEPTPGQLDPLDPKTYEVVGNVINDIARMFPDNFYHGGADEINSNCWKNSSDIQQYLEEGHTLDEALTSFLNATKWMIESHNKTTVYWEDVLTGNTTLPDTSILDPKKTILQVWMGCINTKLTTSAGFRTIVSAADVYYLDCGHGQWMGDDPFFDQNFNDNNYSNTYNYAPDGFAGTGGDWCAPFKTWQRIYDYDITANLTAQEAELVIGGEVALWSEQADETVLDAKLWPRSAALAETLWSGNHMTSSNTATEPTNTNNVESQKRTKEAINRLNDWRFRLVGRGIQAEPMQPLWCLKHPGQCNSQVG